MIDDELADALVICFACKYHWIAAGTFKNK